MSSRQRSRPEDNETDPVDTAEEHNGLVLAQVLIRDDGTENRSHCRRENPELANDPPRCS